MTRLAIIPLLLLVLTAGAWSLLGGTADLLAWQAGRIVEDAPGRGVQAGGPQDQTVRRVLTLAQGMAPGDARHREQLAQHLERLALQAPPRGAVEQGLLREAHRLNVQAAGQRPTWPLGLTAVLRTRFKLGQVDPQFTRLYSRAADLGRSEPAALDALVTLGLAAWPLLDPQGQGLVQGLLRHGLALNPRLVLTRAVALQQGALVEPLLGSDANLRRLYAAIRAQAPRP